MTSKFVLRSEMQKAVMQNIIIMWIRRQACHAAVSVTAVKMTAAVCSAAGGGVITRDTGREKVP